MIHFKHMFVSIYKHMFVSICLFQAYVYFISSMFVSIFVVLLVHHRGFQPQNKHDFERIKTERFVCTEKVRDESNTALQCYIVILNNSIIIAR